MKKLVSKFVFGLLFLSLVCLYSGGVMAMDMKMDKKDHCGHCYTQEILACNFDEAVIPNINHDDFNEPVSNDFSFYSDSLDSWDLSTKRIVDRPPDKCPFVSDSFVNSNVVLLI